MANENANRSHAGLVLQMFPAPDPPKVLASWGFVDSSAERVAGLDGAYSVRLTEPASGLIGPTADRFESIDSVIVSSAQLDIAGGVLFLTALLLPDPALPAPVVGEQAQLPMVAIQLTDDSGPVDGAAVLQLEVRAVPQQT